MGQADTQETPPPFLIHVQYIKDLSFENPKPLESFGETVEAQPSISVDIQAKAQDLGSSSFEVLLEIRVDAKRNNKQLFLLELSYGAIVALSNQAAQEQEEIRPIVMVGIPHILFPFARKIVADTISDGGFPPLLLSPVDFSHLYRDQLAGENA